MPQTPYPAATHACSCTLTQKAGYSVCPSVSNSAGPSNRFEAGSFASDHTFARYCADARALVTVCVLVQARGQSTTTMRGERSRLVVATKLDAIRHDGLFALHDEDRTGAVCGDYPEAAEGALDEPDEAACAGGGVYALRGGGDVAVREPIRAAMMALSVCVRSGL